MKMIADDFYFRGGVADDQMVVKLHYATDDVAQLVADDIERRFNRECAVMDEGLLGDPLVDKYSIDFGGSVSTRWTPVRMKVDGVELSFWAHHVDTLYHALNQTINDVREGGYCKLHTWQNIFCGPKSLFENFLAAMKENDAEIRAIAEQEYEDWKTFVNDARKENIPIRFQDDDDDVDDKDVA